MSIDRDRAAHSENVGGLHGFDCVLRVQEVLDIVPGRPALDRDHFFRFVQLDLVDSLHVQHEIVLIERLPAHAVTHPRHGHFELILACELQGVLNILHACNFHDPIDGCPVEATDIVDRPAFLLPLEHLTCGKRSEFHSDLFAA